MKILLYASCAIFSIFACNQKVPASGTGATDTTRTVATPPTDPISPATADTTVPLVTPKPTETVTPTTLSIPSCIQNKIDSIKKLPVWNPPAEIYEYVYEGKKVFLMSADCCDFFSTAVDANCNYLCAPSGGFTGRGDGKCKDFLQQAKMVRLVWKDERTRKAN